jgi:uncharacterized GH25 family protein
MKILVILFSLLFSNTQIVKTQLHITVRNDLGNTVPEASVTLYANEADYEKEQNPVQSGTTDEKGIVKFKELKAQEYFVLAKKGDTNNFGGGEKTGELVANRINKVNIIIQ